MKKNRLLLFLLALMLVVQCFEQINAQYYCFWLANYTDETLSMVRLRETGTSSFGNDVFEGMLIEPYEHYTIRTRVSDESLFDVEVSQLDGKPIKFSWVGQNGISYTKPYIILDLSPLNTLMLTKDEYGNFEWSITDEDDYSFGNPCEPWN